MASIILFTMICFHLEFKIRSKIIEEKTSMFIFINSPKQFAYYSVSKPSYFYKNSEQSYMYNKEYISKNLFRILIMKSTIPFKEYTTY